MAAEEPHGKQDSPYAAACMLDSGSNRCQCVLVIDNSFCADLAYRYDIDMTKCIYW